MAKKKNKPETKKYAKQELVDKVVGMFENHWKYVNSSWHQRWEDNYNLYNNQRIKYGYEGITDTFVPMTFSTVEMMTSALFGTKPTFNYIPPQSEEDGEEQDTQILNSLLDYYWDKDQWSIKFINWGRDFIRLGTSVIYLYWDGNMPRVINVPIRDFIIDPSYNGVGKPRYIGRRYLTTKDELESFEIVDLSEENNETEEHEKSESKTEDDTENVKMKKKYTDLDQIGEYAADQTTDKEQKDIWYGSTLDDPKTNQVEVIEMWYYDEDKGEDRVVSIANRCAVIEDVENWYKVKARENGEEYPDALNPFCWLRNYVDGSLFYAKSDVDFIADQQELLNDLTNQNIDSITFTLNQMYTLDPKYLDKIDEVENLPGAVYPFEAGALQPIPLGNVPQDAFNERLNIKSEIRETSASNEVVKGASQEGGKVTATEIQAQIAGAGQRIGLKITQIEDEGFHMLARLVFAMVRLYVTKPMMVRVVGDDGVRWEEFDPEEFKNGEYDPRVQLETTVNSEKQAKSESTKEMLAAFLNDPDINQQELKKLVLTRSYDLDPDEVQMLMAPPEMPMGGEVPPEMMGAEAPPDMGMMPQELPQEQMMDAGPELPQEGLEQTPEVQQVPDPTTGELIDVIVDPVTGELIPIDPIVAAEMEQAIA